MNSSFCDDLAPALGSAVLSLDGPKLLFLCSDQLTHGPWLLCISTALFLPNHKSLGFPLSTVGTWILPIRSIEALFSSDPRRRVLLS